LKYLSFRLQIVASTGSYTVYAFSPQGEGRAPFVAPYSLDEVRALNLALERSAPVTRHLAIGGVEEPERTLEAVGERLFEALFQGETLRLYERSRDLVETNPDAGLRIEMMLDPRDPRLVSVQALPWELLRQPGTPEVLALNRQCPVVRYLAVPRPIHAAPCPSVLRILAVAANPRHKSLSPLNVARELRNLKKAAGTAADLQVVTLKSPTLAGLRQALLDGEYHVLHFMGHGGTLPAQTERVLFFEDEKGLADPVRGTDLVNKLAGFPSLRLVVLNACESAALPDGPSTREGFDPFAGVANALVLGGMPAVIAMQLPISDEAAITFSRALYRRLAAGDPVDAAVTEGRQEIHSADPAGFEWATPVLFMRTRSGELFPEGDIPPETSGRPRRAPWLIVALLSIFLAVGAGLAARNWFVERLVRDGVAHFEHGQWHKARELFEAARELAPGSAEVLSDLAGAEEKFGDIGAAEEHFRGAVRQAPDSPDHLYNLGRFLNSRRRFAEAYDLLQRAVVLDPERAAAYGELAQAAVGRGMLGRARLMLATALRLDPGSAALYRRLGETELNAGRPEAAVPPLMEARRRYPLGNLGQVETVSLLAQAYDRLDDSPSACREIGEFRRLDRLGVTPWAPAIEAVASRRGCPPRPEKEETR